MMSLSHIHSIRSCGRLRFQIEQIFASGNCQSGLTVPPLSTSIDVVSQCFTNEIGHLMINMEKNFSRTNQETYRHGAEHATRCEDCATFSGWFGTHDEGRLARWESHHRCGSMIARNASARGAVELEPVIDQEEYVKLELAHLFAQLHDGNQLSAAVSIHTVINELHKLELRLDVDSEQVCGRVTTSNGVYRRWSYLTAAPTK